MVHRLRYYLKTCLISCSKCLARLQESSKFEIRLSPVKLNSLDGTASDETVHVCGWLLLVAVLVHELCDEASSQPLVRRLMQCLHQEFAAMMAGQACSENSVNRCEKVLPL